MACRQRAVDGDGADTAEGGRRLRRREGTRPSAPARDLEHLHDEEEGAWQGRRLGGCILVQREQERDMRYREEGKRQEKEGKGRHGAHLRRLELLMDEVGAGGGRGKAGDRGAQARGRVVIL